MATAPPPPVSGAAGACSYVPQLAPFEKKPWNLPVAASLNSAGANPSARRVASHVCPLATSNSRKAAIGRV